jgi:hypothetical protein
MKCHSSSRSVPSSLELLALLALLALAQASAHGATPAPLPPSALPKPCPLPGSPPDPAAARGCVPVTPAVPRNPTGAAGGTGGGAGSGGAGGGGGGGTGGGAGGGGSSAPQPSPPTDVMPVGPFIVKQIETLGGESISGGVCRLGDVFAVNFVTPRVAFTALFTPVASALAGNVSYRYSIPSAGESHAAQGNYTGQVDTAARAVHISMFVSDHVVFKGFDGNIPNRYKFDLVATPDAPCVRYH